MFDVTDEYRNEFDHFFRGLFNKEWCSFDVLPPSNQSVFSFKIDAASGMWDVSWKESMKQLSVKPISWRFVVD